jgi:hypothetical protein
MFGARPREANRRGRRAGCSPRRGAWPSCMMCPRPRNAVTSGGADLRVGPRGRRRREPGLRRRLPAEKPSPRQMRRTGAPTQRAHARAERAEGEGNGGEGQALRGQGRGLEPHLRMTRSEPCCGVQQVGHPVERQEAVEATGGRCRSWASRAKWSNARGWRCCLVPIMGGPRDALVAPLPQCRTEHHFDGEIWEHACPRGDVSKI